MNEDNYIILKKEVDALQIELSNRNAAWHQNPAIVISILALVFSFGTTLVSYYSNYEEGVRSNRREARELIQRISKLPIENFELMQRNQGDSFGEQLSGMLNQENILLASQASELLKRYPDSFLSNEYFSVALALAQSSINDDVPFLFENAIDRSRNHNDYNTATRAYAGFLFGQGDLAAGRKYYELALKVWEYFPENNLFTVNSTDAVTLMYWSNSEMSAANCNEARIKIDRSMTSHTNLPASPLTESLATQIQSSLSMLNELCLP